MCNKYEMNDEVFEHRCEIKYFVCMFTKLCIKKRKIFEMFL